VILVAGLGNPGPRYASTRHNVGFMVVDRLAARAGAELRDKFHGEFSRALIAGATIGLLKPLTFMNDSGRSVQAARDFYRVPMEALFVVHDELDVGFGEQRLKVGGGDAGHRGIRSIAACVGAGFARLRVGVGRPPAEFEGSPADFVLQGFSLAERNELDGVLDRAADALVLAATRGISVAMNATNQRMAR
jgi:PTH1 family peptidyl-tRNA hydrolase